MEVIKNGMQQVKMDGKHFENVKKGRKESNIRERKYN